MYTLKLQVVLAFAIFKNVCNCVPLNRKMAKPTQAQAPNFMWRLYEKFRSNSYPFSKIVHSNRAIGEFLFDILS